MARLAPLFREEQLLDVLMLAGWYHAISFTANGARVACEDGAPHFADVQCSASSPVKAASRRPDQAVEVMRKDGCLEYERRGSSESTDR